MEKLAGQHAAAGLGGQIVWGGAADELNAYYGLATGGVVALQLTNGERRWFAPPGSGAWFANRAATTAR